MAQKTELGILLTVEELEKTEALAEKVKLSRNKIVQQIIRKYFGLPSVLPDALHYEPKEVEA